MVLLYLYHHIPLSNHHSPPVLLGLVGFLVFGRVDFGVVVLDKIGFGLVELLDGVGIEWSIGILDIRNEMDWCWVERFMEGS